MVSQTDQLDEDQRRFVKSMSLRRALDTHPLVSREFQVAEYHRDLQAAKCELQAEHDHLVAVYALEMGYSRAQAAHELNQLATALQNARERAEAAWMLALAENNGDIDTTANKVMNTVWLQTYADFAHVSRQQIVLRLRVLTGLRAERT